MNMVVVSQVVDLLWHAVVAVVAIGLLTGYWKIVRVKR